MWLIFQGVMGAVDRQIPPSTAVLGSSLATLSSRIVIAASGQSATPAMPVLQPPIKVWQQSVTQYLRNFAVHKL